MIEKHNLQQITNLHLILFLRLPCWQPATRAPEESMQLTMKQLRDNNKKSWNSQPFQHLSTSFNIFQHLSTSVTQRVTQGLVEFATPAAVSSSMITDLGTVQWISVHLRGAESHLRSHWHGSLTEADHGISMILMP